MEGQGRVDVTREEVDGACFEKIVEGYSVS